MRLFENHYTINMSKKDFVLHILEKIEDKRALAKDLKKFLVLWALDNEAINALVELFRQMAVFVKNKATQEHMLKAATILENMKEKELEESIAEQQEVENLLLWL